jgi:CheY-like chemotaxis protein
MKILAVDDEPSILELLKTYLEASESHQVAVAASGKDALEMIRSAQEDFDCLLIDIQMPQMNGIMLCEHVRAMPDYSRTPIIMLTAMSQRQYIDKAFSAGATDYVTKPFDFLELRGRLQSAKTLVGEITGSLGILKGSKQLIQKLNSEFLVGPDEPISLEGIPGLVGYEAFENYVLQLSRASLLFAFCFAVKIADFKVLHDSKSSIDVMDAVKNVAKVLADQLCHSGNFISYRGNGVFLCINHKRMPGTPSQREAEINTALVCTGLMAEGETPIRVVAGDEIPMRSISKSGALFALRRAVTSVEEAGAPARDMNSISKIIMRSQSRTVEQSKLERRAYQIVLEDLVREERRTPN